MSENIELAISNLSNAVASLNNRVAYIEEKLIEFSDNKSAYLTKQVNSRLPDFSKKTLVNLEEEFPDFVDDSVVLAFSQNWKFWFFSNSDYEYNLDLIRIQLTSYFDQIDFGKIGEMNRSIQQFNETKNKTEQKIKETIELIKLLKNSLRSNVSVLPAEVVQQVNRINATASTLRTSSSSTTRNYSYSSSQQQTVYDDNADIWINLLTGIPTSFRTLMYDCVESIIDNTATAAVDNNVYVDNSTTVVVDTTQSVDVARQEAIASDYSGNVTVIDPSTIATDDSLGSFS